MSWVGSSAPGIGLTPTPWGSMRIRTAGHVSVQQDKEGPALFSQLDSLLSSKAGDEQWAINALMNIGDTYASIVKNYDGDIRDIIGKMDADIESAYSYMNEKYNPYVESQFDYFAGGKGIKVEDNDAQRRATYMGNVASQSATAREDQHRQMAAQGLNPYANAGNQRAMLLNRNASMAGAGNQAYGDWLSAHNQQRQADQQARSTYADMLRSPMDVQLGIMQARGMPLKAMNDMMNLEAQGAGLRADAAGKLLDYNTALRGHGLTATQSKLDYTMQKNKTIADAQSNMADANAKHFSKGVAVF